MLKYYSNILGRKAKHDGKIKGCLIGLQKGVSKDLKGRLLQGNWASFRSQKSMCWF